MADYSAAEHSDPYLAEVRQTGELQKADPERYFREVLALSDKGSVNAMARLAWAYHQGIGTDVDLSQAEQWYRRAWEAGSQQIFFYLGSLYWGQGKLAKVFEAYTAGAAANDQRCLYWLGWLYRDGLGVTRDRHKARELFERSSSQGNLFARSALAKLLMSGHFGIRSIFPGIFLYLRTLKEGYLACLRNPACADQWR